MSVQALSWAFAVAGITAPQKAVLLSLANAADAEGYCYPSQKRIAREACVGRRTAQMALAALEAAGLIRRAHRRRENGSKASDAYWLLLEARPQGATDAPCGGHGPGSDKQRSVPRPGAGDAPCASEQGAGDAPPLAQKMRHHPNRHLEPSIDPSATRKAADPAASHAAVDPPKGDAGRGGPAPDAALYRLGAKVLGPKATGLVRRLREAMADDGRSAEVLEAAAGTHDARAYVMGCIQNQPPPIDYRALEREVEAQDGGRKGQSGDGGTGGQAGGRRVGGGRVGG